MGGNRFNSSSRAKPHCVIPVKFRVWRRKSEVGRSARSVIGRRCSSRITLPPMRSIHSATIRSGDASCAMAGNNAHASRHGTTQADILVTLLHYYKARQWRADVGSWASDAGNQDPGYRCEMFSFYLIVFYAVLNWRKQRNLMVSIPRKPRCLTIERRWRFLVAAAGTGGVGSFRDFSSTGGGGACSGTATVGGSGSGWMGAGVGWVAPALTLGLAVRDCCNSRSVQ